MKRSPRYDLFYQHIIGQISGDGTAYGRMNAVEGGWSAPEKWNEFAKQLVAEGFTLETVGAELDRRWTAGDIQIQKLLIDTLKSR